MKKQVLFITLILAMLLHAVSCQQGENVENNQQAADSTNANVSPSDVTVDINDVEIQSVFQLTNSFRTGNEAFYLNEDNTTTTNLVGKLSALTLDSELCKAAAIRAKEIVGNFSHTRPNGSICFTVLQDISYTYSAVGENIAAGNKSGSATFNQWKEDDENYGGQGHRRNMLNSNFTKIGIAYSYDANSTYKYYWTMILAK